MQRQCLFPPPLRYFEALLLNHAYTNEGFVALEFGYFRCDILMLVEGASTLIIHHH